MTIEERAAKAADLKTAGACNCSQAVVKVFEDMQLEWDVWKQPAGHSLEL